MSIHAKDQTQESDFVSVMSKQIKINLAVTHLLEVLQILVLNCGCVHQLLEGMFGKPKSESLGT